MATKDPRIDAYIAKSAPFARPILKHLRQLVHRGCPEVVESIKWGMPAFEYKGLLGGIAGFKAHCALFFRSDVDVPSREGAMGQFGRITSLKDLPADDVVVGFVRKAVALRDNPETAPKKAPRKPAKSLPVPPDLRKALATNPKAGATFAGFAPSHRREYITWITEAKRPETRQKRLETTLAWLSEGKKQNWRYEKPRASAIRR